MNQTRSQTASVLAGGLLPVILFTVIEEYFGIMWGLAVSMIYGASEIAYEKIKYKTVSKITWLGNLLLIGLGAVSFYTQTGIWFKLQPALLEVAFAGILFFTSLKNTPLLVEMARKQGALNQFKNENQKAIFENALKSMNNRLVVFLLINAVVTVYAALYTSTRTWAMTKGVGFTVGMLAYMIVEIFLLRKKIKT